MKTFRITMILFLVCTMLLTACDMRGATNTPTVSVIETSTEQMETGTPSLDETGTPMMDETGTPSLEETETPMMDETGTPMMDQTGTPMMDQTTTPMATSGPLASVTINVSQDATLGSFLVDDEGFTLYMYAKDTMNTSTCTGDCAKDWHPLLVTSATAAVAGNGVDATKLGLVTRADGTLQVSYNGWPLYYYADDTQAGDINGQGEDDFYVISPKGDKIDK